MFTAALFRTAPNWKPPKGTWTVQCVDYLWDVHKNESTTNKHMEETHTPNVEQKKPDTTENILYDSIYVKCKKI